MPLVTTKEMFRKAYEGGYAIGAFNVNNMEIIQGITEAGKEVNAPLILQVSSGARKYANHTYLVKLVEAAVEETNLPIALHLDHGDSFELCKACIDGGFTSVMIDGSKHPYEENIALTKKLLNTLTLTALLLRASLVSLQVLRTMLTFRTKMHLSQNPNRFTILLHAPALIRLLSQSVQATVHTNSNRSETPAPF